MALDVFERPIRRIYLSATLRHKTDFVRAFGRVPGLVVEPQNDAGNGERLIIAERAIEGGFKPSFVGAITKKTKVLVAVPSYRSAAEWDEVAAPPKS